MAGDTSNPRIWIDADVYVGDVGATEPTDVSSPWSGDWEELGLLSEDGMSEDRSESTDDKYAWGGILIRTTRSKHKRTIKITALEDNPVVFGLVNPGFEVETAAGITTRTVKVPTKDIRAFGLETVDGDITRRRVIPTGEVTNVGTIKSSDSDMTMYELTITIYPDAEGVLYVDITDDPQAAEGS